MDDLLAVAFAAGFAADLLVEAFEAAGLADDDFAAVFAAGFAAGLEAGLAEDAFLLPADDDLLAGADDLLAAALPLEVDDFAESLFDFVVAIFLSLGYVKNVLKQTYERIFTRINSVCQGIF